MKTYILQPIVIISIAPNKKQDATMIIILEYFSACNLLSVDILIQSEFEISDMIMIILLKMNPIQLSYLSY